MNEELKPCPFCGQVEVHKPDCFFKLLSHASYVNKPERVKAWQFRPIEDALRADNARLRAALERINILTQGWEKQSRNDAPWWNLGDIARAALSDAPGQGGRNRG